MKICYLAHGQSVHTERWLKYFVQKGHEVHLITLWPADSAFKEMGVIVHEPIKSSRSGLLRKLNMVLVTPQIIQLIHKIKPDILHAHNATQYGLLAALSSWPYTLTVWGSDITVLAKNSRLIRFFTKIIVKKAKCITCDGYHMIRRLVELGAKPENVRLIFFGTDVLKFKPRKKDIKLRHQLSAGEGPLIISLRGLTPLYDVGSLIRAAPIVLKQVPNAKFLIFHDGEQRAELEKLSIDLRVSKNVKFMGRVSSTELPKILTSMDVYVSTSLSDAGIAASTAEAMACGLPVVITDFEDNKIWVKNGINGFLVPLKNPEALAEKIIFLLKNKTARLKFGKNNRKIIEKRNNYYVEMDKMEKVYKTLLRANER
jgi:glycosyltransferase involved in cell wall biosynthesis